MHPSKGFMTPSNINGHSYTMQANRMPRARTVPDDAVLAAAARVVRRSGPAGFTLAAVGEEAGLSAATLVQRYGSKRALLLAVAETGLDAIGSAFATGDVVDGFVALAGGVTTPEAMANSLAFLHLDLVDDEFRAIAQRHWDAVRAEVARITGDEELARRLLVTYNGSLITWAVERDGALADRLREDLSSVIAAGGS
jgi:AcrR family transcriptional regulator